MKIVKRTIVSLPETSGVRQWQKHPSGKQRQTLSTALPRILKKNVSSPEASWSRRQKKSSHDKKSAPITAVDLETPEQGIDEVERQPNLHYWRM